MEVSGSTPLVYRGAKEICAAVGLNSRNLRHYVEEMGLPAFRIDETGRWIALPEDLCRWVEEQRDKRLGPARTLE